MLNTEVLDSKSKSPSANPVGWWQWRPSRRAVIVMLAVAGVSGGLLFGWNWIVAAGLSSVILGLLPCVAMCAAGLCMNRMGRTNACGKTAALDTAQAPNQSQGIATLGDAGPPLLNSISPRLEGRSEDR